MPPASQASPPGEAWDDLAVSAIALGLAPLLHVATKGWPLPSSARAKLAVTYQANQQRNQAIAAQLGELLAAYAQANLQVIVLKGGYLAFALYPDPALRGMTDLDLLFHPDDLSKAEAVLRSLGYQGRYKPAEEGPGIVKHVSTYKREGAEPDASTPNPYLSLGGDRHVDPHGSLEESWFGLRVDVTPGVWQRSAPVSLVGQTARAMAREDLTLQLAVHVIFHLLMGRSSLVQLYDLGLVCQLQPPDWDLLLARAHERQAVPFLYAALHLTATLFAAPVPQGVLTRLNGACQPGLARYITSLSIDHVMRQTQRPPAHTIRQRLTRGIVERRETARWAPGIEGKWAVWRTAIAVARTDTARLAAQSLQRRLQRRSSS